MVDADLSERTRDIRDALAALRERVAKLTGPDREAEWLVAELAGEVPEHTVRAVGWDYDWNRRPGEFTLWKATDSEGRNAKFWKPEPYTASVDAVLELIGKVLPGWWGDVDIGSKPEAQGPYGARLWPAEEDGCWNIAGEGPTPALALLNAILSALPSVGLKVVREGE